MNQIYHEEEAELFDERHPDVMAARQNWKHVFDKYFDKGSVRKILDVCTGTGFVPSIISEYTSNPIICSDLTIKMLDVARVRLSLISEKQCEYIVCDAEKLPLGDNTIDIVTIDAALHHLPTYGSFLNEASRVLSTNGLLFIMHEPNRLFHNSRMIMKLNKFVNLYLRLRKKAIEIMEPKRIIARAENQPTLHERVNRRLVDEKVVPQRLSKHEIQALVDIHSPTASGTPKTKGFTLSEIMQYGKFRLLEFQTYNFLGKIDPKEYKSLSSLDFICSKVLRNKGSMFWMVLKKE
jgi:ubiquinone/menaquinone biosynthesis C-methylase UbiE